MRGLVPTAADLELAGVDESGRTPRPSGLSSLDLHGNHVGDEGCSAVADMLRSPLLGSLTQLGLSTPLDPTLTPMLWIWSSTA